MLDGDLGLSGTQMSNRQDFKTIVADVSLNKVGAIFALEASRLSRSSVWKKSLRIITRNKEKTMNATLYVVEFPDHVHERLRDLAKDEGISLEKRLLTTIHMPLQTLSLRSLIRQ